MSTDERIRRLERAVDRLLMVAIAGRQDTFQTLNQVNPNPVDPEVAAALDIIANEGKGMIARGAVKKRRKVSKYARAYGRNYKALRKKHPRAQHATIVKKAHAQTKRQMKKK